MWLYMGQVYGEHSNVGYSGTVRGNPDPGPHRIITCKHNNYYHYHLNTTKLQLGLMSYVVECIFKY